MIDKYIHQAASIPTFAGLSFLFTPNSAPLGVGSPLPGSTHLSAQPCLVSVGTGASLRFLWWLAKRAALKISNFPGYCLHLEARERQNITLPC